MLDLQGYSLTVALSGAGIVTSSSSGAFPRLTVGANGASSTFSGAIQDGSGQVSLAKTGAGTLVLTGNNTYTGDTPIFNGTLVVNGSANLGGGTILDNGYGTTLSGTGSVGAVHVHNTGVLAPGYTAGAEPSRPPASPWTTAAC